MKELISIVIPVYNVEKYLKKCLESIIEQTYKNLEILLINDGSTDRSLEICEEFAKNDKRIHVINQENQGLSAARNMGLETAKGKYISFVDSDDYISKNMIETLMENLMDYQADISCCNYQKVYKYNFKENKQKNKIIVRNSEEELKLLFGRSRIPVVIACGKIYKKELFRDIRYPIGKIHEDEFTTYKVIAKAKKIVHTEQELYYYVQRSESITTTQFSIKNLVVLKGLEEQIEHLEKMKYYTLLPDATYNYLRRIAMSYAYFKEENGKKKILKKLHNGYIREYRRLQVNRKKLSLLKKGILFCFSKNINIGRIIVKGKKILKEIGRSR